MSPKPFVSLFSLFLLGMLALTGCTRTGSASSIPAQDPSEKKSTSLVDPWPEATTELRKQNDIGTCRRIVAQLNLGFAENPSADAPSELQASEASALAQQFRLSPEESAEVAARNYTSLDAAYLAQAFYLRDAVRSLDLAGLPPERQASVLFEWVCRQVYLQNWIVGQAGRTVQFGPVVPPSYILRRGYGTGIERSYVFIAALQQAGFDGVFIGNPGQEQGSSSPIADGKPTKGPFWAVAARVGNELLLFDPWRGEALPGPKGAASLREIQANPALLNSWFDDKSRPWDVSREQLKSATAYVTLSLSSITPRMKLFEKKITTEIPIKLAHDPNEVLQGVSSVAGGKASIWAPPINIDAYCMTRVLRSFLPAEEGGTDRTPAGPSRFYDRLTIFDTIPLPLFTPPADLTGAGRQAIEVLFGTFINEFKVSFSDAGLREKIHRGQFNDVIAQVVRLESRYATLQQRYRTDPHQAEQVRRWCQAANQVYEELSVARLPENVLQLPAANSAIERFWKENLTGQMAVIDQAVATAGLAEAAYLLALCKHEQAERIQLRQERLPAGASRDRAIEATNRAWATAKDAWDRYENYREIQNRAYAGRADHAKALAARATARAAAK